MDWITWGFCAVILIVMGIKWFLEWKMYKNSVYSILYGSYTEYRMRRKSIEKMAESYVLQEKVGDARMIFQVLDSRRYNPASFITVVLKSGVLVFGVCGAKKPGKDALAVCREFYRQNAEKKLKESVYGNRPVPVSFHVIVPDQSDYATAQGMIRRSRMLQVITDYAAGSEPVFQPEDVEHIFRILAKEALQDEDESSMAAMLTKD